MPSVAPGVYWNELNLSEYAPNLSDTVAALVGTAAKGPIGERSFLASRDDVFATFGLPSPTHPALYAALEYASIGQRLYFTRVQAAANAAAVASSTVDMIDGTTFDLDAKDPGSFYNDAYIKITHDGKRDVVSPDVVGDGTETTFTLTLGNVPIVPGTVSIQKEGVEVATDSDEDGTLEGGTIDQTMSTVDYDTGVVVVEFSAANPPLLDDAVNAEAQYYSTFSLFVLRNSGGRTFTRETWSNMVLAPVTNENYYGTILAQSNYFAVPTITAFPSVTGASPPTLTGGTDGTTGIVSSDYVGTTGIDGTTTGLEKYKAVGVVDVNTLACPGISDIAVRTALIEIGEIRNDLIVVPDPPKAITPAQAVDWADGANAYAAHNAVNSTYAALYYPWLRINDAYNAGASTLVPPSGFVLAAFARTDYLGQPYDAPAGFQFGRLQGVIGAERILTQADQALLYNNRINPVVDFAVHGVMIWGHKTATTVASKLDRVATRRFLLLLEKSIVTLSQPFVFRALTPELYALVRNSTNPLIQVYIARGGLETDSRIVCDGTNNTAAHRNRNELVVDVYVTPVGHADTIFLNFVILPSTADISESLI